MDTATLYSKYLECSGVSTDTRNLPQDCLFVALKGPNFNGDQFAAEAIEKGAKYALVSDESLASDNMLVVEDTLEAMQALANHHRKQLSIPFIGITGSNGKTTTKELVREVLHTKYKTYATQGNLNNHIGVPLTLLNLPTDTEVAIVEMGANHVGEIADLCQIAEPTHGLVTNIGRAHLEGFGSPEGVKKGKGEMYAFLAANDGTAFVNQDQREVIEVASGVQKQETYGTISGGTSGAVLVETPFLQVEVDGDNISTQLVGKYNIQNILAAMSVAKHFDVPHELAASAIEAYLPSNNRSQVVEKDGNTYILDAYNANPSNVAAALENLGSMEAESKVAIIGAMKELGEYSADEHLEVAKNAKNMDLRDVILVGEEFVNVPEDLGCVYFNNVDELKDWLPGQGYADTLFLVKGSRLIALEKLLD